MSKGREIYGPLPPLWVFSTPSLRISAWSWNLKFVYFHFYYRGQAGGLGCDQLLCIAFKANSLNFLINKLFIHMTNSSNMLHLPSFLWLVWIFGHSFVFLFYNLLMGCKNLGSSRDINFNINKTARPRQFYGHLSVVCAKNPMVCSFVGFGLIQPKSVGKTA